MILNPQGSVTIGLVLVALTGCSMLAPLAMDALTGADKKEPLVGIDTEIVAGDKTQGVDNGTDTKLDDVVVQDNAQIHTNTVGKATDINQADSVTLNEGVPYWQSGVFALVALLLGVFMPQLVIRRKDNA